MEGIALLQDLGFVLLVAAGAAWVCQRLHLPEILGYLTAGLLISPHTHSFTLINDVARVQSLAQVGLVFLIFNIGQQITLQRIKKVGLPLILATALIAIFVLAGCRMLGSSLGWPHEHSLTLAAILMVSSTAVLGRSLRDAKLTNTTFGQTALTITALDDLVAVVMLTVLASVVHTGSANASSVVGTVVRLNAVLVVMLIGSLLVIPRLLNRLNRNSPPEISGLVVAALLLGMALLSAKAGFSTALGAFVLGTCVSTAGKSAQVTRVSSALCDVFGPVFFVGMGMLLDIHALAQSWPLAVGVICLVFVLRIAAASAALLMVGHSLGDGVRAAVCLTPIGEFSLILALTGVQGGIVPESFYAVAVGVCFITSFTTPILIQRSGRLSAWVEASRPKVLAQMISFYHDWIENLKQRQTASLLWRLTAPRIAQVVILVLFVAGLLSFASPFYLSVEKWLGPDWPMAGGLSFVYWSLFITLVTAPLVAIWRQLEALAMICSESAIKRSPTSALLRPLFETLLRTLALTAILGLFATLVPYHALSLSSIVGAALVFALLAAAFWRRLIKLHSRFEIDLQAHFSESPFASEKHSIPGWPASDKWKMSLAEVALLENANGSGLSIANLALRTRFECTIVRVERQGVILPHLAPETILFPNDHLLLLGTESNLKAAEQWLNDAKTTDTTATASALSELSLGNLTVPPASRHIGKSLGELGISSNFGIQVVGIERQNQSCLSPGPKETFGSGDRLLVLGTPEQVSEMAAWLRN
ncbi:MAG: cation:proton antiporter [Verrucomicrobiales bacterium]